MAHTVRNVLIEALSEYTDDLQDAQKRIECEGGADYKLYGVELDSLSMLELMMSVEDRLGIELDVDDVSTYQSLNALDNHISGIVARKAAKQRLDVA